MATLALFRTRVSSKIGLDNTAASAEQTLVDGWLNEGVIETLLALKCYVVDATMPTTSGQGDYQLDSNVLEIRQMFVTDLSPQSWSMQRVDPDEILYMRRVTIATSAPPRFYALNGANLLMLYPIPSEIDQLTIYYVPRPAPMSNPVDDPSLPAFGGIPTEFHKLVEWWALTEAADFADDSSAQNGAFYMQKFMAKVKDYRRRQLMKGGRLPRKLPGDASRSIYPPGNAIDIPFVS